jgi:hypothetical protein
MTVTSSLNEISKWLAGKYGGGRMEGATPPPNPPSLLNSRVPEFVNVLGAQPETKNLATGVNSTITMIQAELRVYCVPY